MKQPKFKFGEMVQRLDDKCAYKIRGILLFDGTYFYTFTDAFGDEFSIPEKNLQLYTPPPRTYSVTKQQLAEAWDASLEINASFHKSRKSAAFAELCSKLGIENE